MEQQNRKQGDQLAVVTDVPAGGTMTEPIRHLFVKVL